MDVTRRGTGVYGQYRGERPHGGAGRGRGRRAVEYRVKLPALGLPTGRKRVEDSVELRGWVLAAVLVGEAAVLTSGYFGALMGILVPLLTVVAFVVSYHRRRERNILIKVMLAFGALAMLAVFFREALSSLYDTRVPLARLFLWVQVIHAFDLPARKDLAYSLVSGLILVAVGAVLTTSLWYRSEERRVGKECRSRWSPYH